MVKARSSGSSTTAELKDFIAPVARVPVRESEHYDGAVDPDRKCRRGGARLRDAQRGNANAGGTVTYGVYRDSGCTSTMADAYQ